MDNPQRENTPDCVRNDEMGEGGQIGGGAVLRLSGDTGGPAGQGSREFFFFFGVIAACMLFKAPASGHFGSIGSVVVIDQGR